ncbi:hypothetical protein L1049_007424 [Liquidambar formosana]|uniref:Protein kinase domain-containing protein n=1 Tax=Liquidambar formosana TaxID=63359 RepID=A0AAP0N2X8_LIQFO
MEMEDISWGLIVGISLGVIVGVVLAISILFCIRYRRKCFQIGNCSSPRATAIPIRISGVDSSKTMSDSTFGQETPRISGWNDISLWLERLKSRNVVPSSGIPKYSYKDLRKATYNFTTEVGQGAFGPVYKAEMSTASVQFFSSMTKPLITAVLQKNTLPIFL